MELIMSWKLKPMTDRVIRQRAAYRDTVPEICIARYKIITEFYMNHPELNGILRRAKAMKEIFEKIPVRIGEDEVIVGMSLPNTGPPCILKTASHLLRTKSAAVLSQTGLLTRILSRRKTGSISMIPLTSGSRASTHAKTQAYYPKEYAPSISTV